MPLSSILFLLPEALCLVLIHPLWKECQLVKPEVLEPFIQFPALLGNYFLHTLPLPQNLQGLHMTVLLHATPTTHTSNPSPKRKRKNPSQSFKKKENTLEMVLLCCTQLRKRSNYGFRGSASSPKGRTMRPGRVAEGVPEGPIQTGPTGLPSSQIHLEDAPTTLPGRMSLSSLREVHSKAFTQGLVPPLMRLLAVSQLPGRRADARKPSNRHHGGRCTP